MQIWLAQICETLYMIIKANSSETSKTSSSSSSAISGDQPEYSLLTIFMKLTEDDRKAIGHR